jgi:SulP family sulfate permease
MSENTISNTISGDISGALTAAIITLPMSIAYGVMAFSALGPEFVPLAALAGVFAAIFAGFFACLFSGSPIQITGPMIALTLVLSTFVSGLVSNPIIDYSPAIIFGMASLCVFLAGCLQIFFGFLGISNFVKYIPQSIISGFINGIALLVIIKQINPIFGVDDNTYLIDIIRQPMITNPITVATGITTIVSIYFAQKYLKKIPSSLVAIISGTASYYLFLSVFPHSQPGQIIGSLQTHIPRPDIFIDLFKQMDTYPIKPILPQLLVTSLVISLIASMESLLSAVASDSLQGCRHNSKREIIGQGIGNVASSLFGSIASAGSIIRTTANYKAGGRTRVSGMLSSVFILLFILLFGSWLGKVPMAVFAAIIFVIAIKMIDKWTSTILRNIFTSFSFPKEARMDMLIISFVAVVTVSINLIAAVGVGMLVASIVFISKISRSVIKRHILADYFHSRKMRPAEHIDLLEKIGRRISILQLQGPIFFGSAERLAEEIQSIMPHSDIIILDFKRVSEIDSTGSSILIRTAQEIEELKKNILFTNLQGNKTVWSFLKIMKFSDSLKGDTLYPDTDSALEWAEENLLRKNQCMQKSVPEIDLQTVSLFGNFTPNEFKAVQEILIHRVYAQEETVFFEKDSSRDLYILMKGLMTVSIYLPERERYKRLFTYSPGVVFGEMSFLDGSPRSAGVQAHEDSEAYCLSYPDFELLSRQKPEIANKLLKNIALEISRRLRRTSNQVRELEES